MSSAAKARSFLQLAGAILSGMAFALLALSSCSTTHTDGPAPLKATPVATLVPSATGGGIPSATATGTATPLPACSQTAGEVERIEFTDPLMTAFEIPVNVYLPPCYRVSANRYPVVYLLHGYPQDQGHWLELGLQKVLDERIASGAWPAVIAVMPQQPEPYFTHTDGGPGSLEQVILDGLVPFIDANFQTRAEAGARAIAGISRGGVWALEIGLRHPDVFQGIAALSPALSVNHPRPPYDPGLIASRAEELPVRIWLSVGDSEPSFQVGIDRFAEILDRKGIEHVYLHSTGHHEDSAWRPLIEPLFEFLLAPWRVDGA